MSHGEHTISQIHILLYLPASFWMCFWDLTSSCEKLRPGCLGSDIFLSPFPSVWLCRMFFLACSGAEIWSILEECIFSVDNRITSSFHSKRILSLSSRTGVSEIVVFDCPGILQNSARIFFEINNKVRKWYFCLLKYGHKKQVLAVWKNASKYMTK